MIGAIWCEVDGCEPVTSWPSGWSILFGVGVFVFACWVAFCDLRD